LFLDNSDNDIKDFNATEALQTYQHCFIPLHYHELWSNIVKEYNDGKDSGHRTSIDVQEIDHFDHEEEEETSILTGTYSTIISKCSYSFIMISLFP
jgi:hypothetical protein